MTPPTVSSPSPSLAPALSNAVRDNAEASRRTNDHITLMAIGIAVAGFLAGLIVLRCRRSRSSAVVQVKEAQVRLRTFVKGGGLGGASDEDSSSEEELSGDEWEAKKLELVEEVSVLYMLCAVCRTRPPHHPPPTTRQHMPRPPQRAVA